MGWARVLTKKERWQTGVERGHGWMVGWSIGMCSNLSTTRNLRGFYPHMDPYSLVDLGTTVGLTRSCINLRTTNCVFLSVAVQGVFWLNQVRI